MKKKLIIGAVAVLAVMKCYNKVVTGVANKV